MINYMTPKGQLTETTSRQDVPEEAEILTDLEMALARLLNQYGEVAITEALDKVVDLFEQVQR